jgi:hypothetical protein
MGTYLSTTNAVAATACIACGGAYICPLGSSVQTNCPGGTYVSGANCLPCVAGKFCPAGATAPIPCPMGAFTVSTNADSAVACTFAPAGSFVGGLGANAATTCAAGSFSPVQGASACQLCAGGTFDATTAGRTAVCPACPANSFCLDGKTKTACPANTASGAGTGTPLGCTCIPGFLCAYTKRINAIVKLNSTVTDFTNDVGGVKTRFIQSVATAAGVPSAKITIISALPHTGGRRRALLSLVTDDRGGGRLGSILSGRRALLQSSEAAAESTRARIRVHFEALDVHPARDFKRHLREQANLIIG